MNRLRSNLPYLALSLACALAFGLGTKAGTAYVNIIKSYHSAIGVLGV